MKINMLVCLLLVLAATLAQAQDDLTSPPRFYNAFSRAYHKQAILKGLNRTDLYSLRQVNMDRVVVETVKYALEENEPWSAFQNSSCAYFLSLWLESLKSSNQSWAIQGNKH